MYRVICYRQDGHVLYSIDTACFYEARAHYWGAEVNPQIGSVTAMVDRNDGKGWQHLGHRATNH